MPTKPLSHSQRERAKTKAQADRAYNATQRSAGLLRVAAKVHDSRRWKKVRRMHLNASPLCVDPEGIHCTEVRPATQVDHIVSIAESPASAYDMANLQSLCTLCHGRKSARERQRGKREGD